MSAAQTAADLSAFKGRGAGTDAERRAARWLASELARSGREAHLETFWCRPNWALAHAWHVSLAVAGSLVAVSSPRVGGALVLAALISVILDERLGFSPGRRLTPERASQNVVATRRISKTAPADVHLIITANYDAGRTGLVYRDWLRVPLARLARPLGRLRPGWLGWLVLAFAALLTIAILRVEGNRGTLIGVLQLIPTAVLVVELALLLELGSSGYGPAASDNSSGVAVATSLAAALDAAPPQRTTVELVLQGAGDGFGIGLRKHLAKRRRELGAANTVVLGIAPCGAGEPRWWVSDGQLIPLRYFGVLTRLCSQVAGEQPELHSAPHRGRGATPAYRAVSARRPAVAIGCLDRRGLVPRSHQAADTADQLDRSALDGTLQFGLVLVDAVDAFLRDRPSGGRHRVVLRRPLPVFAGRQREPTDQLRT